jgi:hypothetical protein
MTNPRQLRRHARRIRRSGLQPMMLLTSNDRLPDSALVLFFRWVGRYRSELAPAVPAAAAVTAAWWLHSTHSGVWPLPAGIASVAAWAVVIIGHRFGLTTLGERLYAAGVVLSVGGWLAAATVLSPFSPPLPQILITGGLVLAVPWWTHGRRRARVRVERKLAAWPEIAQAVGLAGSQVMSAVVDLWGWRARFRLARGQTIDDVRAKLPAIESGLGTFRGAARVYPTPDDLANRFELRVLDKDPHADAITWPGPSTTTITEPIDLGPFEDATPAKVLLLRRHGLLGGATGSGKSGGLNVLMGNLSACADVDIWAIDLKRGMELGPWASCIGRLATTPAEARTLLASAVAILETRAAQLAANGKRIWEPTPQMPALIIIIDEYAELAEAAPDATADSDSIARRGRAVAVTLVAATQRPTQKAMGQGALRSQMDVRISFRVRERRDVDLVLGQGMFATGWHAHTLNAPGKFLISAPEHDTPRRARAYLITDDAVQTAASQHADRRPVLDPASAAAADAPHRSARAAGKTGDPAADPGNDQAASDGNGWRGLKRRPADPEALLWEALEAAPADGVSVADLMQATGMGRSWVYYRLADLAAVGRAIQTTRGSWRASREAGDDA